MGRRRDPTTGTCLGPVAGAGQFSSNRFAVSSANPSAAFISASEFAQLSGLSPSTVGRYLKRGLLPKVQPGGPRCRVLIPRDALNTYRQDPESLETEPSGTDPEAPSASAPPAMPVRLSGPAPRWLRRR